MFKPSNELRLTDGAATKRLQHKRRCLRLPQPTSGEINNMIAAFVSQGGSVTRCPAKFVAPTSTR